MLSAKKTGHVAAGSNLGESSNAASFKAFSLVTLSLFRALWLGAFLTGFFGFGVGFGFGFALALVVFALGFAPTLALPSGVLGPGLSVVAALLVLLAGVRPVCALGRLAGFPAAVVAYVRVLMKQIRPTRACDEVDLGSW